ncbi:helix-turn-helix transcriptional regulator [Bacillus sp. EAC]|uniref:helix-turn-helix domain-containing protein n=1 Tax=Bacillus sp. EAC TaxID=1978338 RepID=UPI000B435E34|nr:helix-turn-helix transcriptional regulator [Bacillus sp. EAC]
MYEGRIIKYYRLKYKLSQEQLGKGICSVTHISKLERNQTEYSSEIINLLSERLGINMELEVKNLLNIKQRLFHWHDVMINELSESIELINNELEDEKLLQISDNFNLYQLLRVRYLLLHKKAKEAFKIIGKIEKIENKLTTYESNLLKHVLGIYYLERQDYIKAIQTLKVIDSQSYNNPEYYYHLAIAYHTIQSPVLAYYYAEKSHQFFKEINSYLRVIDAELIMIIQVKNDGDFRETIKKYENLIKSCEICNAPDRKSKVLHNLAYEHYRRKNYEQASKYYNDSMSFKNPDTSPYLLSLEGYIRSSYDGKLISNDELIRFAEDGLKIAIRNSELLFIHLFKLLLYLLKSKVEEYHKYLFSKALPMYNEYGFIFLIQRSKKELFNYYTEKNLNDKALEMAELFINS